MSPPRQRSAAEHAVLVQNLQLELLADDLDPPAVSAQWSEERLKRWFEAGGVEVKEDAPVEADAMHELEVQIPSAAGALHGKLLWPRGAERPPIGLCWCSANPGKRFGAEHMDSPVPLALAAACREAALPLLRFDYSGVRGSSSDGQEYDQSQPHHPNATAEARNAFAFLRARGCAAIAIGGHSMGASSMMNAAATGGPFAIVSSGTAPMVGRYMPPPFRERILADINRQVGSLPRGVPKLFIVGEADPMSPREEMERLVVIAPEPRSLETVPAARHNFEGCEAEVAQRIVRFVLRAGGRADE